MRLVLTGLIFAGGLMFLLIGIGFLIDPASSGVDFGMKADGPQGLSTMRADMTAFFVVAAVSMVLGAWRRNGDLLLVAAALFGIALTGRIVSLIADGTYDGFAFPMLVEAVTVIVLLIASRVLPHRIG
ncbi:DUF4345 family protein [Qipengyuania oceanensis]|uniref:DUF4345 domain-containing protein n=1 Tax=Qipengyuania oceanensis TaxID=1463597 RepID=A0A844YKA9_9SPHN|nr:DUF4345 family protein [Qipengyuania oceanensis]MXO63374.1 DUF4345 domain-containing protein [Qipengyuania oceanensis]